MGRSPAHAWRARATNGGIARDRSAWNKPWNWFVEAGTLRMEWSTMRRAGALVGSPAGRIDEDSWQYFSEQLNAAVQAAALGGQRLIVDLAGVDYMSSRGLRALTLARKQAGKAVEIVLAAPNARMREILAISRYDKIFPVVDAVDQPR